MLYIISYVQFISTKSVHTVINRMIQSITMTNPQTGHGRGKIPSCLQEVATRLVVTCHTPNSNELWDNGMYTNSVTGFKNESRSIYCGKCDITFVLPQLTCAYIKYILKVKFILLVWLKCYCQEEVKKSIPCTVFMLTHENGSAWRRQLNMSFDLTRVINWNTWEGGELILHRR